MKRTIYNELKKWKNSSNRRPLVLYGARQVGKTWILKEFGKTEYNNIAYFNFDADKNLNLIFENNIDPSAIINSLKGYANIEINPQTTLIIFDEIQECQRAKDALKYFNELSPQYHITAAGSFLGIADGKFPVGQVDEMTLYPMSFYEFLLAKDNKILLDNILSNDKSLINTASISAIPLLKEYFYVGGMPKAVKTFIETEKFEDKLQLTRQIQKEIIDDYNKDFSKHIKSSDIPKVRIIWDSIPSHLSKEKKKFIYKEMKEGARATQYETAMEWLIQTGLVYKIKRVQTTRLPLKSYTDDAFKLFISDVGLLSAMCDLDINTFLNPRIDIFTEFKGALTEQYVLQELKTTGLDNIFYWGNETGKAEVDFLFQYRNNIIPLEVKSDIRTKSKSLNIYIEKNNPNITIRSSLKGLGYKDNLYSIPLYAIASFKEIIKESL